VTSPSPKAKLATGGHPSPLREGVSFPPLFMVSEVEPEGRIKEGLFFPSPFRGGVSPYAVNARNPVFDPAFDKLRP